MARLRPENRRERNRPIRKRVQVYWHTGQLSHLPFKTYPGDKQRYRRRFRFKWRHRYARFMQTAKRIRKNVKNQARDERWPQWKLNKTLKDDMVRHMRRHPDLNGWAARNYIHGINNHW